MDSGRDVRNMRTWDQSGTSFLAPGSTSHGDAGAISGEVSGRTSRASTVCVENGWGPGMAQARELEAVIESQLSPSREEEESFHRGHRGWMSNDGYEAVRRPEEARLDHIDERRGSGSVYGSESGNGYGNEYGHGMGYGNAAETNYGYGGGYNNGSAINNIDDAERGYGHRIEVR